MQRDMNRALWRRIFASENRLRLRFEFRKTPKLFIENSRHLMRFSTKMKDAQNSELTNE